MAHPSQRHWDLLIKTISYLYHTLEEGLVLKRSNEDTMKIEAYVDSDYAGSRDDRKSITGFVAYLNGMTMSWKSKKQATTTLSSTEVEYVALTHCTTEVLFIKNLLKEMKMSVSLLMIIHEDNAGALFLAQNHALGLRTKHINVRYHFVRDLIEKGLLELKYISTNENVADIMTKNLNELKHKKFGVKLLNGKDSSL